MSVHPGDRVMGRYRITRQLAAGGMGVVWLARIEGAEGFARPAVVKQILPVLSQDDELVRMFVREARVLSALHHPNIVGVLDFVADERGYLMALEYVHGYSVGHWAKHLRRSEHRFDVPLAMWVVVQVLDALHYAHTRTDASGRSLAIVHRDVSPSNVLIDVEGHVKLVDFGVARPVDEHTRPTEGEVSLRGKFPYMAPELLAGGEPGPRSDLYACGVLLHELLCGRNEFRNRDPEITLGRVFSHRLSALADERPDVPAALDAVIHRATAKEPRDRFADAGAMADALRELLPERESRLRESLREAARETFLGDLPATLDVDPLDALEEAWKHPPPETLHEETTEPDVSRATSDVPTAPGAPIAHAPRRGRTPVIMAGVVAAVAILALAGVAFFLWTRPPSGPERVVVVERHRGPTDEGAPAEASRGATASEAPDEPDPGAEASAGEADAGSRPRAPRPQRPRGGRAAALTAAFERRQPQLRRCFSEHTLELEGRPQITIRFEVGRSGAVESATLSPAALAPTALGRCLLGVARDTSFASQPAPVAFRIPIRVRGG
ncbi:MAG TPA: protein kinase [Sandaracinaceae bacterium LLY-WYZ-13_1]|nr:protein kinase [Sandaracinaceae bacterium LLY-WYZ-13_1]